MPDKVITAEMLRRQKEEMDAIKAQGDEQLLGKLEEVMMKTSEIDLGELMGDLQKLIDED